MLTQIKPEALYEKTNVGRNVFIPTFSEIIGTATGFDTKKRQVIVEFGDGLKGVIPENEVSVEKFTYSNFSDIPHQISNIIGTQVRAIVTGELDDGTLVLSRHWSMLEAWNSLKENSIVLAQIKRNIGYGIFLDIGHGLTSYLSRRDCSNMRISNTNFWFNEGDYLKVRIVSKGKNPADKIFCERKSIYPSLEEEKNNLHRRDVVLVRIGCVKVDDGYLCEYTPRVSGIIDSQEDLKEGEEVLGVIKKVTDRGLRIRKL